MKAPFFFKKKSDVELRNNDSKMMSAECLFAYLRFDRQGRSGREEAARPGAGL